VAPKPSELGHTVLWMVGMQITVSGSFRRAMDVVQDVVEQFSDLGVLVLSPADPRIVDQFGDFVFVASDRVRRLRTVQERHLAAIGASDFLWLVAPEGYVGQSAAMEIGYAAARAIPIYSDQVPTDLTLRQWVTVVSGPREALRLASASNKRHAFPPEEAQGAVLLDPLFAIEASHDDLLIAKRGLLGQPSAEQTREADRALERISRRVASA
jgi:hypothetical protein